MIQDTTTSVGSALITSDQYIHLVELNLVAIGIFKLVVLIGGLFTIYLGYRLLADGVKGQFKFKSSLSGAKADLVSVSPGTLFVLLGVILMASALLIKFQMPVHQTVAATAPPLPAGRDPPLPGGNPFSDSKK